MMTNSLMLGGVYLVMAIMLVLGSLMARPERLARTLTMMLAWVAMSILFGLYVTYVASYASVFGHLATFFVLLLYVYASSIAFLVGVQADACIRRRAG